MTLITLFKNDKAVKTIISMSALVTSVGTWWNK